MKLPSATLAMAVAASTASAADAGVDFSADFDSSSAADFVTNQWKLPCLNDGWKTLHIDGEMMLRYIDPSDFPSSVKAEHFPLCLQSHWRKLWTNLGELRESFGYASASVGSDGKTAPRAQHTQPQRRQLAAEESVADASGIRIYANNSHVSFGKTLDASIYRSGNSTLSVTKNLNVEGVLTVDGQNVYNIGRRQCSGVNTSASNGNYTISYAPTDGDYIVGSYIDCDLVATHPEKGHSYRPVPLNRWACDEEGGKAYPVSLLCHPSNTTGFPTDCDDNLVYYLDAWASPPNGDTWYDLSGINTAHPAVWTQVMSSSPAAHYHDSDKNKGAVSMSGSTHLFRATEVEDFPEGNDPFTWELGFSIRSFSGSPHILSYGSQSAGQSNGIYCNTDAYVLHYFYSDDNAIKQFSVNEVQHLVVTYDQEYLRAWVNGVKVVEAAESSKSVTPYSDNYFNIGGGRFAADRTGMNGDLYYLRLYDRALTESEILGHWDKVEDFKYRDF